jgi:hypothetical protein
MHQLTVILGAGLAIGLVFLSGYLASRSPRRRGGRAGDGGSAAWLFTGADGAHAGGHGHCDAGGHGAGCDGGGGH